EGWGVRLLIVVEKSKACHPRYPRREGVPEKRPLGGAGPTEKTESASGGVPVGWQGLKIECRREIPSVSSQDQADPPGR
ncbi:MAG: hypothetical protein ACM3VX_05090, partial [Bacteroidota bacterium]